MDLVTTPKMPRGQKWSTKRLTLGLVKNALEAKLTTAPAMDLGTVRKCPEGKSALSQRLTLGLVKNATVTKLTTSKRLTLRLEKNGLGAKISTQRLTLGLSKNAPRANPYTSPASPSALPFIAYQHCPSKQGKERELSIGNL